MPDLQVAQDAATYGSPLLLGFIRLLPRYV